MHRSREPARKMRQANEIKKQNCTGRHRGWDTEREKIKQQERKTKNISGTFSSPMQVCIYGMGKDWEGELVRFEGTGVRMVWPHIT